MRSTTRLLLWSALAAVVSLGGPVATATPCFDLYISTGGVTDLEVGQTLALRVLHPPPTCLPTPYLGKTRKPAPPAEMEVAWSVDKPELATITAAGVLTAVKPGQVVVQVACRDPKAPSCALTSPGKRWINVSEKVRGGRLPRLDAGPRVEDFRVMWDATPYQSRHEIHVSMTGEAFAWTAGFATPQTPDRAFPWALMAAENERWFDDDEGRDAENGEARHRANVTAAGLTIDSWKDGLLTGRLVLKTTRGVEYDASFQAWLPDRDGVLRRATSRAGP